MSFKVDWSLLETASMSAWTKDLLSETLNSGKRPNILASDIEIKDLNFGKIPPSFEILEIGELEKDRLRGIFKIRYDGDAHITLHTKVQANPLKIYSDNLHELEDHIGGSSDFISPNFLLLNEQFSLPLDLKLSDIKLLGIGVIVFSKTKGLTLVFRNDPLESIKVSSTFDVVQVLAKFLQKQIEHQIRELFRETLPSVLHRLSLKYISLSGESFDLNNLTRTEVSNEITLFDLNSDINYSVKNLQRNLQLFNSRETLDVNVPKFRNLIQRSNVEKYNRNLSPNLLTSLNLLNANSAVGPVGTSDGSSNGIPLSFIVDKDPTSLEKLLKNISNIQSNSYYKITTSGNPSKPKRRRIKLGKRKEHMPDEEATANSTTLTECEHESEMCAGSISDSTLIEESVSCDKTSEPLAQPSPKRLGDTKPIQSHSHFHRNFYNTSPNNSNSSLLSGVGIGNNYFNFTRKDHINYSLETDTPTRPRPKKLLNHLDMKVIRDKLEEIKRLDGKGAHFGHAFEPPPPPPYRA